VVNGDDVWVTPSGTCAPCCALYTRIEITVWELTRSRQHYLEGMGPITEA
jgi:hypothetical protein